MMTVIVSRSFNETKPVFEVSDKAILKPLSSATYSKRNLKEISVYYKVLIDTFRSLALVYGKLNGLQEANLC